MFYDGCLLKFMSFGLPVDVFLRSFVFEMSIGTIETIENLLEEFNGLNFELLGAYGFAQLR